MPARPRHGHGRGVGAGLSFPVVTLPLHPAPCDKIIVPLLLSGESLLKRGFQACNLKCPETSLLACSGRWALGPWVGGWALPWGPSRPSPREASEHSTRATRGRRRRTVCGERARRSAQWGASDTALQGTRRRLGAPARASRTYSRARSTRRAKLLTSRRRRVEGRRRRNVGSEGAPRGATFRQPPGRAAGRATGSEAQPLPGSAAGRGSAVGPDSGPGDSRRGGWPSPPPAPPLRASPPGAPEHVPRGPRTRAWRGTGPRTDTKPQGQETAAKVERVQNGLLRRGARTPAGLGAQGPPTGNKDEPRSCKPNTEPGREGRRGRGGSGRRPPPTQGDAKGAADPVRLCGPEGARPAEGDGGRGWGQPAGASGRGRAEQSRELEVAPAPTRAPVATDRSAAGGRSRPCGRGGAAVEAPPPGTGRAVGLHPSRRPGWKGHPENWTETWAGRERREDGAAGTRPGPAAAPRAAPLSAGAEQGERVRIAPRSLADARRRRGIQSPGARRARR